MPTDIVRHQTPEEIELLRKREELASVRAELAERELELADLRAHLRSFEGRYLREVGVLYAELDEWDARIAELEASLNSNSATKQQATEARDRASQSHDATHGEASWATDFHASADLKSLFRELAKQIHPDFSNDDTDRRRRHELMAKANEAYSRGDSETLRSILDDYNDLSEAVLGEGIGAQLIRAIRQLHEARKNIVNIEQKVAELRSSEIAEFKQDADTAELAGRDLLAELAQDVVGQISQKKKEYAVLELEIRKRG
jgi:hypothetical protein